MTTPIPEVPEEDKDKEAQIRTTREYLEGLDPTSDADAANANDVNRELDEARDGGSEDSEERARNRQNAAITKGGTG